jgi:precorrin-6B C5,15-methyltransferase / cobalt-precorrin-6B C5,C15-methyltransferase
LTPEKVHIIGMGDDGWEGLTRRAREVLEQAEIILGGEESLRRLGTSRAEIWPLGTTLEQIVQQVERCRGKRAVLLAQGDPLFYGTARFLCDRFGKEAFEVEPHVSSMQLAFARIKESWDDAYLGSLANQPLERVVERARTAEKVGLFPTEEFPPRVIARALLDSRIDYFQAYVCENLGSPDERVTKGELSELADQDFGILNVMILVRKPHQPDRPASQSGRRLFGNPDEVFLQSMPKRGLITPSEVRSIALAELDLGPSSIVWDVGAGSGSVAIEAAEIAREGKVFAIERDAADHQLILANAENFQVRNLTPVLGQAPEAWGELPDPDAIFVGGSGREVQRIVELAFQRLRPGGRLVATVSSIDTLAGLRGVLEQSAGEVQVWMINIARGTYQMDRMVFESLNPTFIVAARKPERRTSGSEPSEHGLRETP